MEEGLSAEGSYFGSSVGGLRYYIKGGSILGCGLLKQYRNLCRVGLGRPVELLWWQVSYVMSIIAELCC